MRQENLPSLRLQPPDSSLEPREAITRFEPTLLIDRRKRHVIGAHMRVVMMTPRRL
jgi:hypothetical protein